MQVAPCGARRVVATLEFFEHPVSELSHNDLLVTLTLSPTSTHALGRRKCSIRRASGLVQTGILVTCPCQSPWAGNYRKSDFSSTTENHCRIARDPRGIVGFLPNRPVPRTNGRPSTSTASLVSWRCLEVGGWKTNFSECFAANSPTSC